MTAIPFKSTPIYEHLQRFHSQVTHPLEKPTPQMVWKWLGEGKVILKTHAGISVGEVREASINWKSREDLAELDWEDHLVELQAFNSQKEWRIWGSSKGLMSRQRADEESSEGGQLALDTHMKLRGVVAEPLQTGSETLLLKTRNYLAQNDATGASQIVDQRCVEVVKWKKGGAA